MNIDITTIDFYDILLDEGEPFYNQISQFQREYVNDWLQSNLKHYVSIDSYNEVIPSQKLILEVINNGYDHINNQCHYSAKRINQINADYKYITGFVFRGGYPYPIITHSFNFNNGTVVDFARFEEEFSPIPDDETLPHHYYGIEIPHEFVINYIQETIENKSMSPLLFEWLQSIGIDE